MLVNGKQVLNDVTSSTINKNEDETAVKKSMSLEKTKPKISRKQKLYRAGAAIILKQLYGSPGGDENVPLPVIPKKSNVARRGKAFRPQARRARFIDLNSPNSNPETLTELVTERNFCRSLLLQKEGIRINVKLYIEDRMTYVNFKLDRLF